MEFQVTKLIQRKQIKSVVLLNIVESKNRTNAKNRTKGQSKEVRMLRKN